MLRQGEKLPSAVGNAAGHRAARVARRAPHRLDLRGGEEVGLVAEGLGEVEALQAEARLAGGGGERGGGAVPVQEPQLLAADDGLRDAGPARAAGERAQAGARDVDEPVGLIARALLAGADAVGSEVVGRVGDGRGGVLGNRGRNNRRSS